MSTGQTEILPDPSTPMLILLSQKLDFRLPLSYPVVGFPLHSSTVIGKFPSFCLPSLSQVPLMWHFSGKNSMPIISLHLQSTLQNYLFASQYSLSTMSCLVESSYPLQPLSDEFHFSLLDGLVQNSDCLSFIHFSLWHPWFSWWSDCPTDRNFTASFATRCDHGRWGDTLCVAFRSFSKDTCPRLWIALDG
jgi:hypothetical protein